MTLKNFGLRQDFSVLTALAVPELVFGDQAGLQGVNYHAQPGILNVCQYFFLTR